MSPSRISGSVLHDEARAVRVADVLRAVAHPLRLRLVAALCEGPAQVMALAERLNQPQAIVSQQLRILRMSRLVSVDRSAGHATYRLREPQLRALIACTDGCALGDDFPSGEALEGALR